MKKKIVLASVLKPPDDVRMYEKLGKSLADNYEVHLFGQTTECLTNDEQVRFYPLFRRGKWQRLKASWIFFRQLRKVNPEAIIVCTVELLPSALLYKILFRKKLFYDVQENYAYNFMYQHVYPFPTKYLMALAVRTLEWISRPLVNHYFLAEQTYAKEFSFSQGKHTILENKAVIPSDIVPQPTPIRRLPTRFVYSGTISAVYGALDALDFILQLKEHVPSVQLLFIGRFAEKSVAERIKTAAQHHPTNVQIIGGDEWVSHRLILQVLSTADIAILPYRPNKSTANCIPTKLYECLALCVPMLIRTNSRWQEVCEPYQAAVFTEFGKENPIAVMKRIENCTFYTSVPKNVCWEEEKTRLNAVLMKNFND